MIRTILATVLLAVGISGCYTDAAEKNVTSETTESLTEGKDQCETAASQEALTEFQRCKKCTDWCMDRGGYRLARCIKICKSLGRCP